MDIKHNELTVDIASYNVEALDKQVDRLNRRAEKLGLEPTTVEYGAPVDHYQYRIWQNGGPDTFAWTTERDWKRHNYTGHAQRVITATLRTPGIQLKGWCFVGAVDHEITGNVLRIAAETVQIPKHFRTDGPTCDHCGTKRRRKTTYILQNSEGFCRVGSSCVDDFLGHDVAKILEHFNVWRERLARFGDEDEMWAGGGSSTWWHTETFLAWTSLAMREHGWVSRTQAREGCGRATADDAFHMMTDRHYRGPKPSEQDVKTAKGALGWARAIDEDTNSDYLSNLRVLAAADVFDAAKHIGLVGSIPMAYQRAVEKEAERKRQAEARAANANEHLGKLGQRFGRDLDEVTARVVAKRYIDSMYGTSEMLRFLTPEGNTGRKNGYQHRIRELFAMDWIKVESELVTLVSERDQTS